MILKKENGIVTEITKKELPKRKEVVHLCQNCQNASPNLCEKFADIFVDDQTTESDLINYRPKQPIGEYSYIKSGYQVINEKGQVTQFFVNECDNYQKITEKKLTPEEKEKIKKAKEFLMLYFADASTLEEASEVIADQFQRGTLVHKKRK